MRTYALLLVVAAGLALAACGDDEVAGQGADAGTGPEFRPETEPPSPPNAMTNNTTPGNVNPNNTTPNNTAPNNTTPNNTTPGGCEGFGECVINQTRCTGEQLQVCEDDQDGDACGTWSLPTNCPSPQQVCSNGMCITESDCIDNDNDGFGPNCAAGPDCDDANPNRFPGNPEVCDGIDNDCNAGPDDVDGLGGTCTTGTGACMATGTPACDGGNLVCNVTNPPGSAEVCDMIDNDCDGQIDEGMVCNMMCTPDAFEPNDTAMDAAAITVNTRSLATMCATNDDWYDFTTQNNRVYRLSASFPNSLSDIDMELYENGTVFRRSTGFGDRETIQWSAQPNRTYSVRVYNAGSSDNFYHLQFIDQVACQEEDGFAPNQSIQDAALIPARWITEASACPGQSDFYSMGEVQMGTTVTVNTYDIDILDDVDLFLWADPDGDGTFDVVDSSTTSNSDETVSYTSGHTGDFYYEVRDFGGLGAYYDMQWTD